MRNIQKKLLFPILCMLLICLSVESSAAGFWGKNASGIYVNNQGQAIERAVKKGIDVSYHQGVIDWEAVKQSDVEFVMLRCGVGEDLNVQDDKQWLRNATECERLGIPYGVYLYSFATNETNAASEARHAIRLLQGRTISYPVYYDLEATSIAGLSNEQYAKNAKVFCDALKGAGYETGVYANYSWFTTKLTDPWFDTQNRWIARYNTECGYEKSYQMWQSTSTGTVPGISGNVDIDFLIEDKPSVTLSKAVSGGYNSHKLTWTSNTTADWYEIWCKAPGKSKYTRVARVDGTVTSYTVKKRTTGKDYAYKIRVGKAINGKTYTAYSGVKKAKATLAKATLSTVKKSGKKVTLRWKKVAGANGYKIYYSKKKSSGYSLLKTVKKGSSTSAKITVGKGKCYYKIRAYRNVNGKAVYGGYSNIK